MPHQCEVCKKGFPDASKLKSHIIVHHTQETPHPCRYQCGEAFNDIRKRARHEKKIHDGLWVPQADLI